MKTSILLYPFIIFDFQVSVFAETQDVVHHPAPKKPQYMSEESYSTLKPKLLPPPEKNSARQKKDEKELFLYQNTRKPKDCQRANTEVLVSLDNFFSGSYGPLKQEETKALTSFFDQIRNDADFFIQKLKVDFPRPRPFLYLKDFTPCVPKEVTGAYPSGHAVLSKLFALILSDLYPDKKARLEVRAQQIADDRILAGVHHRSDIEAGQMLALFIYQGLKKSEKYQSDFKALQKQLGSDNHR